MKVDFTLELTFRKKGGVRVTVSSGGREYRNWCQWKSLGRVAGGMVHSIAKKARQNLEEEPQANAQQRHAGSAASRKPCLCDDCEVGNCDMRGQAVECSGKVTSSGTASA